MNVAAATIDTVLSSTAGYKANFVQKFTPKGFKKEQVERGSVVFGSAPQMRWTYSAPESKVFVFDGSSSWLYVPSEKQATVHVVTAQEKQALPFLMLTSGADVQRAFSVKESATGSNKVFTLTPRDKKSMIKTATITAGRDNTIRRLEYSDREGNRTVFEFSGHQKTVLSADLFRFVPPKGVEVVRQ